MKSYGYKKEKISKIKRDQSLGCGCFGCTRERKATKTSSRRKAKLQIKKELD